MPELHLSLLDKERLRPRLLDRIRLENDCWVWTGAVNFEGYARLRVRGHKSKWAIHRASYEVFVGPIPEGLTIDHLCRNPSCINPEHLEPVPMVVNIKRGFGIGMLNAMRTACCRGHEFVPGSYNMAKTRTSEFRRCLVCRRETERARYYAGIKWGSSRFGRKDLARTVPAD